MQVKLLARQWLKRVVEVTDDDMITTLVYSGRGIGSEKVVVDGAETTDRSELLWFVPRFEIAHGGDEYVVQVRVWPWLALRSLRIEKNGAQIYAEGDEPYRVSRYTEIAQLAGCAALLIGPVVIGLLALR